MARQAEQLARLLEADAELAATRAELLANLAWRFGPAEDLAAAAVLAVPAKPTRTYAARLFAHAQEHGMTPRIAGGIVERKRLEKGSTALDVLTGWRLLPQRRTADYAAFQRLVFDGTGVYQGGPEGGDDAPFGLGLIDGETVKAFPLLGELMCLHGSRESCEALARRGEMSFAGYPEALDRARAELAEAQGLAALHRELLQTGLQDSARHTRRTALRAFWTWQGHASVLYAKQSYTPAGKGLPAAEPRTGARVEPSLALYQSLARVVEEHRRFTPHEAWDAFAEVLARIARIASRQLLGAVAAEDERYLNGWTVCSGGSRAAATCPSSWDVHVEPSSGQVLEEATGWAAVVKTGAARGARFTQCEFKHPLGDRLTDAKWRDLLAAGELSSPAASCARGPGR